MRRQGECYLSLPDVRGHFQGGIMGETQRVSRYTAMVIMTLAGGVLWSRLFLPPETKTPVPTTSSQFAAQQNAIAAVFPGETLHWTPLRYINAYDNPAQYISIAYDQHDGMRAAVKLDAATGKRKLLRLMWRPKASDTDLYALFDSRPLLPLAATTDIARNGLQRLAGSEVAPPVRWEQQDKLECSESRCALQWRSRYGANEHKATVVVDRLAGTVREITYE
jgi:hypothetical protein